MELHYRGATYNHADQSVQMSECQIIGQYRGASLQRCHARGVETQRNAQPMKYRGAWVR